MADLYAEVRRAPDPAAGWKRWRRGRDLLFSHHPQSPLPARARPSFRGLPFYDYDSKWRLIARIEHRDPVHYEIMTSTDGSYGFTRFAAVHFDVAGESLSLELYWLDGYAGGLFLPFRDATNGQTTYGGGRYLLDAAKGADLGGNGDDALVLDFNFSYNPSCSYDACWECPLPPPSNRLPIAVNAGERAADAPELR